ncbi:Thaumatin [Trema orientale]|uniref:Thaumatin n=1 Tax=Trema orientale TaxID=63057 RepID=A0A2P5FSP8_TREOI|nr:Thaumatin [Trema orientale]
MNTQLLFGLTLAVLLAAGANAATVTIKNNCPRTIWPATLTGDQKPQLSTTGFELKTGESRSVDIPAGRWTGRFWARTRCSADPSGKFKCATGDCGSGQVPCNGAGGAPPATLIELTIEANGGQDFYDVSNVDGFNIPASVAPQGGRGDCKRSTCPVNINAVCPAELQVKSGNDVVGCLSACAKFGDPKYCCTGPFDKPETCPPTNYSKIFEDQCPEAYSYAYDDKNSTFTCFGGPNYLITFCP